MLGAERWVDGSRRNSEPRLLLALPRSIAPAAGPSAHAPPGRKRLSAPAPRGCRGSLPHERSARARQQQCQLAAEPPRQDERASRRSSAGSEWLRPSKQHAAIARRRSAAGGGWVLRACVCGLELSPAPRYRSPDLLTRPGGPWTWPLPPRGAAPHAGGAPIARHHQHVQGVAGTPRCMRQRDSSTTCVCSAASPLSVPSASLSLAARLIVISRGRARAARRA